MIIELIETINIRLVYFIPPHLLNEKAILMMWAFWPSLIFWRSDNEICIFPSRLNQPFFYISHCSVLIYFQNVSALVEKFQLMWIASGFRNLIAVKMN